MRTFKLSVLAVGWLSIVGLATSVCAERVVTSFDKDWLFARDRQPEAEASDFDDSTWQHVDVPHDWSIAGPFDEQSSAGGDGGFLPTGVGWYRKHFSLPADRQGQRVFIEFDGVMANSDVWINGDHFGHRPNGYVSFYYDITDHVKRGDEGNVLAVRADTSEQVASRWYTGSGIYRHVRLVEVDAAHVEPWGIAVTTPQVTDETANVVRLMRRNECRE